MYITHNNQTYANVRVYSTSGSVRFTGDSLSGVTTLTGPVGVFADNGFQMQTYTPGDFLRQDIRDGSWLLTNIPLPEPQPVVVTPAEYGLTVSTANAVRLLMAGKQPTTADEIIMCSALYDEWMPGKHVAGDIFSVDGDVWECYQNYDNAVYPDIVPVALHGSPSTDHIMARHARRRGISYTQRARTTCTRQGNGPCKTVSSPKRTRIQHIV